MNQEQIAGEFRVLRGKLIIEQNLFWATFAAVPLPVINLPIVTAIQLKMIRELCLLYGAEFNERLAQRGLTALLGGAASTALAHGVMSAWEMAPFIPFGLAVGSVGTGLFVGAFITSASSAATTYAVGEVFLAHLQRGGTLLDFADEAYREFFARQLAARRSPATT